MVWAPRPLQWWLRVLSLLGLPQAPPCHRSGIDSEMRGICNCLYVYLLIVTDGRACRVASRQRFVDHSPRWTVWQAPRPCNMPTCRGRLRPGQAGPGSLRWFGADFRSPDRGRGELRPLSLPQTIVFNSVSEKTTK